MSETIAGSGEARPDFVEHALRLDGRHIRYNEAGNGKALIVLDGSEALAESRLYGLLAQHFRVIVLDGLSLGAALQNAPAAHGELTQIHLRVADAAKLENFSLISCPTATTVALWAAIEAPDRVDALVLISPTALPIDSPASQGGTGGDSELAGRLPELKPATLVLLGTEDRTVPPEIGRMYAQRIPKCYYVLIYDAGHALGEERPDALFGIMRDFLERRESFVVNRGSTALNP